MFKIILPPQVFNPPTTVFAFVGEGLCSTRRHPASPRLNSVPRPATRDHPTPPL